MDICMDDDAPRDQIQQIQTACTPIDSSEFFQDLRDLYPDPGNFRMQKWELIERQTSDSMPNPWIADVCQGETLFERRDDPVFPELNIDYLKEMADRWVNKYPDVQFDRIVLYRYASDAGPSIPVKYAVVFEMLHYERIYEYFWDDSYEQTELKRMKGAEDPHERFIWDTNFRSTIIDKPEILYSDYSGVYKNIAPESFHTEWEFIPQYKGLSLPLQVRVDEGYVVLYQRQNAWQQEKQSHFDGQVKIQVPKGTTWLQIHLRYVNDERIEVDHPGGKMAPYKPESLGLKGNLIDDLCEFADESKELVYLTKNRKYRLNKLLKEIFPGIEGDPITFKRSKKDKKHPLGRRSAENFTEYKEDVGDIAQFHIRTA